jgi:glycosyltransferase involved in cell wall biosynthesis
LGELKVLYAGGLDARKGVPVAIEAIHKLTRLEGQQIELTLAGEGHPDRRAHLEELIARAGLGDRVHFRRAVPRREMPQLLQRFDALVLPSGNDVPEPLARVVMEAMACGLVVIATDCGGTPEMIQHGVDGLLFAPDDSRALAEHLYAVAADLDLRHRLAAAARQTAKARFDINRMIDEMESFLLEVFERPCETAVTI